MATSVALVHDEPAFVVSATAALERAGFEVMSFSYPMIAMNEIESARTVDTLITRVGFPSGKPTGISLALVLRTKLPRLNIVFVARDERETFTEGIGVLIPHPVYIQRLIEAVRARPDSN